jgi:pimeloyl-ACP methyl ester carboxylesterase
MTRIRHVVYLHGFASSPASGKAQRFATECASRGVGFTCPDLNEPEFETLTVTRMLEQTRAAIAAAPAGPVALVGSSLGAFVAVHAAARDTTSRVARLILMAPAFDFGGNRLRQLGEHGIEQWRADGSLEFFHYAHNQPRRVWFRLYEDAAQYDAFGLTLTQPVQIFMGRHDETVMPQSVADWAAGRANVDVAWLDDGHQLADSVDTIITKSFANL